MPLRNKYIHQRRRLHLRSPFRHRCTRPLRLSVECGMWDVEFGKGVHPLDKNILVGVLILFRVFGPWLNARSIS